MQLHHAAGMRPGPPSGFQALLGAAISQTSTATVYRFVSGDRRARRGPSARREKETEGREGAAMGSLDPESGCLADSLAAMVRDREHRPGLETTR